MCIVVISNGDLMFLLPGRQLQSGFGGRMQQGIRGSMPNVPSVPNVPNVPAFGKFLCTSVNNTRD